MRLKLSMLKWPEGVIPDERTLDAETTIGRGQASLWMLKDPLNEVSRVHCVLAPFGDTWHVTDKSKWGTFINSSATPLGLERSHELHDGDRIAVGAYIFAAHYEQAEQIRSMPAPALT